MNKTVTKRITKRLHALAAYGTVLILTPSVFAQSTVTATHGSEQKRPGFTIPSGAQAGSHGGASQAGNGAAAMQMVAMGVNVAAGGMLMAQCGPKNPMACAMAAMAFSQASQLVGSSKKAKEAGAGMATYDYGGYDTGTGSYPGLDPSAGNYDANNNVGYTVDADGNPVVTNGTKENPVVLNALNKAGFNPSQISKDMQNLKNTLTQKGIKVSKDGQTITLPDGRTVPAGALNSEAGMQSAGFSDSDIAGSKALSASINAKFADKIKAAQAAIDGGGGGGGGIGDRGPAGGDGGGGGFKMGKFPWDKEKNGRKKASVSGMSKKLGNDNIGVAGDDIFEMVSRRYKARDVKNDFLKN